MKSRAFRTQPQAVRRVLVITWCIISLVSLVSCKEPPRVTSQTHELPRLGAVPGFRLTTHAGDELTRDMLLGGPWIANTFFTSCKTICPNLMRRVGELHDATKSAAPPVRFISFTVDPDNDTPKALAAYRSQWSTVDRWTLLTGDFETIFQVVVHGFHTAMGKPIRADDGSRDITHSGKLFLVDQTGQIRGYFRADAEGVQDALNALQRLGEET